MECNSESLNKVIDAFTRSHPYDEPAYEIYDFRKRDKNIGITIHLRNKIKFKEIINRANSKIEYNEEDMKHEVDRIAITNVKINGSIINSAGFINCGCIIKISKNHYKLFKI